MKIYNTCSFKKSNGPTTDCYNLIVTLGSQTVGRKVAVDRSYDRNQTSAIDTGARITAVPAKYPPARRDQ